MKKNFKTADLDQQTVSINTNKRHDFSHSKPLTTDIGRLVPVGYYELEPGEELDIKKIDMMVEFQPMLIDSKQSWDVRLHAFSCRKNVLWSGYRDMRYPNYKTIKRSQVSNDAVPYFKASDIFQPQTLDCVRLINNKFEPFSYLWATDPLKSDTPSNSNTLKGVFNNQDEFFQTIEKPDLKILKLFSSRGMNTGLSTFKGGKDSLMDTLDGYPCKREEDFALESLKPRINRPLDTDYFQKFAFAYLPTSVDSLKLVNFARVILTGNASPADGTKSLSDRIRDLYGITVDSDDIYCLFYHIQVSPGVYQNIPVNFYVNSADDYVEQEFLFHSIVRQRGTLVSREDGSWININKAIYLSDLQWSGDFSYYDSVVKQQHPHGNGQFRLKSDASQVITLHHLPVAIANQSEYSSELVAFGYPNVLQSWDLYKTGIADTDLLDATPFRMYNYVHNMFFYDRVYGEDFDFVGNGFFDDKGDDLQNINSWFADFAQNDSYLIDNEKNFQTYTHPNFGYISADSTKYKEYLKNAWFLPKYVAREEDLFTYIMPECDPALLADIPVNFADINGTPQNSNEVDTDQNGVLYSAGAGFSLQNLSWTLETERIVRRQTSIMYNIMNGGRHSWEQQHAITGEYPSDAFLELPSYLGGCLKTISSQAIFNQAQTDSNPLGFSQGVLRELVSCGHIGIKANEQTCVMLFLSIRPHNSYVADGVSPTVQRIFYNEQFAPEFADLAEEDVKGKFANFQPFYIDGVTENHNEQTIGFLPRNTFLKGTLSRVCGEYKDNLSLFFNSLSFRPMEGAVIDSDFMTCKPHDYDSVFVYNDGSDRVKVDIDFDMSISRALSTNPQIKL